jgi:nucleoid DNA-binding protein
MRQLGIDMLETVFAILMNTLGTGEKLRIPDFVSFGVKQKKNRNGRHPQT